MKRNKFLIAGALGSVLVLSGCSLVPGSSEYGCNGMPDSVTCMSVRDVYKITDGGDYQERVQDISKEQMSHKKKKDKKTPDVSASAARPDVAYGGKYVPVPEVVSSPAPVRTPAQIMRILVDPYETDGNLIVPGYIYTEVVPRRWEIGTERRTKSVKFRQLDKSMSNMHKENGDNENKTDQNSK